MTVFELRNAIVSLKEAGIKENQCLSIDENTTKILFLKCKKEMENSIQIYTKKKEEHEKMSILDKNVDEYIIKFKEDLNKEDYSDGRRRVYEITSKSKKFAEMMENLKRSLERYDFLVQEARNEDAEEKYSLKTQWEEVVELYKDYMEDFSAVGIPSTESDSTQEEPTKNHGDIFEEISEKCEDVSEKVFEDKSEMTVNSEEFDELMGRVENYKKEESKKTRFKGFLKRH